MLLGTEPKALRSLGKGSYHWATLPASSLSFKKFKTSS
jgi:hypothetical protein